MIRVTLFNAAPDTGNLGVSALCYSVVSGLASRIPNLQMTVADSGRGIRRDSLSVDGQLFDYDRCGVRNSRRLHYSEALWNIRLAGSLGGAWNPIARHLRKQDFMLDITGGDSFTDLYGKKRFSGCCRMKQLALDWKIPLGLLPQTYGPFQDPVRRATAIDLIKRARFAWARDQRNFRLLRELVGDQFDPNRHRAGVDVAFLLESVAPPAAEIGPQAMAWLSDSRKPTVGLNVSGLIYNDPEAAVQQYGFVADYRQVIIEFTRRLLKQSDANILLVPHVLAPPEHFESDSAACRSVCQLIESEGRGRVAVLPDQRDPRHVKWVISQCDWFCGTRMHATIAGLSTGVPTAAVAYSLKTAGVFETCNQGEHVADPRELSTANMIERLWRSWSERDDAKQSLSTALPTVLEQAEAQMDLIAAACQGRNAEIPAGVVRA